MSIITEFIIFIGIICIVLILLAIFSEVSTMKKQMLLFLACLNQIGDAASTQNKGGKNGNKKEKT